MVKILGRLELSRKSYGRFSAERSAANVLIRIPICALSLHEFEEPWYDFKSL